MVERHGVFHGYVCFGVLRDVSTFLGELGWLTPTAGAKLECSGNFFPVPAFVRHFYLRTCRFAPQVVFVYDDTFYPAAFLWINLIQHFL